MTEEQVQVETDEAVGEPPSEADALRAQLADAAKHYRELLLAGSPEVPAELVTGATVEEVDASFAAARGVVQQVRRRIEEQAGAEHVPAGAPPRAAPDLSGLSPADKIAHALSRPGA
jgi:hypothetical protein